MSEHSNGNTGITFGTRADTSSSLYASEAPTNRADRLTKANASAMVKTPPNRFFSSRPLTALTFSTRLRSGSAAALTALRTGDTANAGYIFITSHKVSNELTLSPGGFVESVDLSQKALYGLKELFHDLCCPSALNQLKPSPDQGASFVFGPSGRSKHLPFSCGNPHPRSLSEV